MRHLIRFMGLIILATGFIGIVIDGTRSMANTGLMFSSLNDIGAMFFPDTLEAVHLEVLARAPAWLWDPVCTSLLHLPASITAFALGFLMLRLGDKGEVETVLPGLPPLR